MRRTTQEKRAAFKTMHSEGCFVIPNPWDAGSAKILAGLGFKALATTSAGFAWTLGQLDGTVSLELTLSNLRSIVEATDLPINADFESGFGEHPTDVENSVRLAINTGVAGLSIDDSTGKPEQPIRAIDDAVSRLRAARKTIDETGGDTLLVGRAENFILGNPDLDDTILRLRAFADAGADCLYAPGVQTPDEIGALVKAVAPKPLNVVVSSASALSVSELSLLGVRRISLGATLARTALGGFLNASRMLSNSDRFDGFFNAASGKEINGFLKRVD
jgi:2-methylisocitrate lyase-like PEP mutase family enzyme